MVSLVDLERRCRDAERVGSPGFTVILGRAASGKRTLLVRGLTAEVLFSGGTRGPSVVYLRTERVRQFLQELPEVLCRACGRTSRVLLKPDAMLMDKRCPLCGAKRLQWAA